MKKFIFVTIAPIALYLFSLSIYCKPLVHKHRKENHNLILNFGLNGALFPRYIGSKHYRILVIPSFSLRWRNRVAFSFYNGLSVDLYKSRYLTLGAAFTYRFIKQKRDDYFHGLNGINRYFLGSAYARINVNRGNVFSVTYFNAVSHQDYGGYLMLDYSFMTFVGRHLMLVISPNISVANNKRMDTFYSINSEQALATGLPVHNVCAGIEGYGVNLLANYIFTKKWSVSALIGAKHLGRNVSKSPIIQSSMQYVAMLSLHYRFIGVGY